eukprot:1684355-Pleurochrysis_carterae.AAC.1
MKPEEGKGDALAIAFPEVKRMGSCVLAQGELPCGGWEDHTQLRSQVEKEPVSAALGGCLLESQSDSVRA